MRVVTTLVASAFCSACASSSAPPPREEHDVQVFVHVETDDEDTVIEARSRSSGEFHEICKAPCDRTLHVDDLYRIGGDGILHSKLFLLDPRFGPTTLRVETTWTSTRVLGIVMTSVGGLTTAMSTSAWMFARAGASPGDTKTMLVMLLWPLEVLVLVDGIVLTTQKTHVAFESRRTSNKTSGLRWIPGGFAF